MPKDKTKEECCEKCACRNPFYFDNMPCSICPCHREKEEKIRRGAEDFANRFTGVMKELAEEDTSTPKNVSWSEEFDKGHNTQNISDPASDTQWVKSFISRVESQSCQNTIKEIIQKIEGMKKEPKTHICFDISDRIECTNDNGEKICVHQALIDSYNQALSDLKQSLEELLK